MIRWLTRVASLAVLLAMLAPITARAWTVQGSKLAAASATVSGCGSLSSAVITYTIVSSSITSATVTGISAACNGAKVSLTLSNGAVALGSGGPIVVAAAAATVPITPNVPIAQPTKVYLSASGP